MLTGTLFCALGFARRRPAGRRPQSASVTTVASAIAVQNAVWELEKKRRFSIIAKHAIITKAIKTAKPRVAFPTTASVYPRH
jgi:hypothetical protein